MNLSPSILSANELHKHPKPAIDALEAAGIVRPANAATSLACADCGSLRRVQLETYGSLTRGYISCPECGIAEVDLAVLRRWALDLDKFIVAVFQASGATVACTELVPQRLWRIGKANWHGRTRELIFALRRHRDHDDAALKIIKKRPKSLLFVPTETDAVAWANEITNVVVALESVATIRGAVIAFDKDHVEGILPTGDLVANAPAKQKTRRRSSRTAKTEALKNVMIEHLRAARDHAVTTRDLTGDAALLACPTKEEFAKQAGIKPYDVTRCFQDEAGGDLNTLWNWSHDLDRVITYRS